MTGDTISPDVCIVGAGPHGLAAATHLRAAAPSLDVMAIDPSGAWMTTWTEQFARAEIATLRSPIVHHPGPNPYELFEFVVEHNLPMSGLPYNLPTTDAFEAFCRVLIDDYALESPLAATVHDVRSNAGEITLETDSAHISTRHLVVATNPHQRPIPDWVWPLLGVRPGLVTHGIDVDLRSLPDHVDETIVVVGGGMTAAHLAYGAARRGATVHLVTRENVRVRSFDTAPGWLGPKFLAAFDDEPDFARRLAMAGNARGGGTMPQWMRDRLDKIDGPGSINLCESRVVKGGEANSTGSCSLDLSDGSRFDVDRIWLATGTQPDALAMRCLRPLLDDVPTITGFPIVDENLRIGPHPAYAMGRMATLQLGPAAGNLWGAQRAAHRITRAITGVDLECEPSRRRVPAP